MMKNAILMSMLFLLTGLSGCLGDEEPVKEVVADPITVAEYNHSFSYQFNNYAPMGMGNSLSLIHI